MLPRKVAIVEARKSCTFALSSFLTFLRHPGLDRNLDTGVISRSALSFWLLIFSFAVTAIFGLLALPLIVFSSASPGDGLKVVFGQSAISVIVMVVILGPLIEEIMFRGWLTGTIQAMAGSAAFLAIVLGGSWLVRFLIPDAPVLGAQAGIAALGLLAFSAIQRTGSEARPAWYKRAFPIVFWSQGIVFGGLHFANLTTDSLILSLLAVLPLILCGWLWGYARIILGFGTAWMLHMAYNVPAALATMAVIAIMPS